MFQTLYDLERAHRHIEELAHQNSRYATPQSLAGTGAFRSLRHVLGRGLIRAGEALGGREGGRLPGGAHARPAGTSQLP